MHILVLPLGVDLGVEDICFYCGYFPILLLSFFLIYIAMTRGKPWAACLALYLTCVPYFLLFLVITNYEFSDDTYVMIDQYTGYRAFEFYGRLVAAAGIAFLWAIVWYLALLLLHRTRIIRLIALLKRRINDYFFPSLTQNSVPDNRILNMVDRLILRIALYSVCLVLLCVLTLVILWVLPLLILVLVMNTISS